MERVAMRFDEYRRQDATALANSIAKKEVSAKEVLEADASRTPRTSNRSPGRFISVD